MNKETTEEVKVEVETNEQHWNGEQQLNKSTGQVEVWYNGGWCAR
jgi:hypothetical protein